MLTATATHQVGDLLNSAYDLVFILATVVGGIAWLGNKLAKRFDKQDRVLDEIADKQDAHEARLVKAETRIETHDLILFGKKIDPPGGEKP